MIDRIQKIMQEKNLTASQFAEALGIQRSGLSHILSGRNQPSLEFVKKLIQRFPDVDLYWFLTGEKTKQATKSTIKREPDLFSHIEEIPKRASTNLSNASMQTTDSLISEDPNAPNDKAQATVSRNSTNNKVKVGKIILLYDDGTYQMMSPDD